jgi:hypothetical protein
VLGRTLNITGSEESNKNLRRSFVDVGVHGRLLACDVLGESPLGLGIILSLLAPEVAGVVVDLEVLLLDWDGTPSRVSVGISISVLWEACPQRIRYLRVCVPLPSRHQQEVCCLPV